jgi:predicted house-cleaning noncanonical NTP pyrophosphatase (MazG superfamily)
MDKEKLYNKLVRDNIPAIIRAQGNTPVTRVLADREYLAALDKKLNEEVLEYLEDGTIGEICDMLEVISAICLACGISHEQITSAQTEKRMKNGAFNKRIWLEKVIVPGND